VTVLGDALTRAIKALSETDVSFALVGGLAVSVRAEPRFTRDVDLVVAVSDDTHAERVTFSLIQDGYTLLASIEHERTGRLATVRMSATDDDRSTVIDLLFASTGIEPEIAGAAETLDVLPGVQIPVARVGHLIASKLLARDDDRRPSDRADLLALGHVAADHDWIDASEAVSMITDRGYHRDRDLSAALAALRVEIDPGPDDRFPDRPHGAR